MDIIIVPFLLLMKSVISFALAMVMAYVFLSWIIALDIFNTNNKFVAYAIETITRVSGVLLGPIRRKVSTNPKGFDVSPIIFVLLLTFLDHVISRILIRVA